MLKNDMDYDYYPRLLMLITLGVHMHKEQSDWSAHQSSFAVITIKITRSQDVGILAVV